MIRKLLQKSKFIMLFLVIFSLPYFYILSVSAADSSNVSINTNKENASVAIEIHNDSSKVEEISIICLNPKWDGNFSNLKKEYIVYSNQYQLINGFTLSLDFKLNGQIQTGDYSLVISSLKGRSVQKFSFIPKQPITIHIVSLDPNGGTVSKKTIEVENGAAIDSLPTPVRKGYQFNGWYTSKTGGIKVTSATKVTEPMKIYAQWSADVLPPAKGTTFTSINLKYKVVTVPGAKVKGKVQVVALTNKKSTSISIPSTVTFGKFTYKVESLKRNVFKNNKKLKTLVVGNNVKKIGDNAFYGCSNLTKVTLGTNVKRIGKGVFCNDKKLSNIKINSNKLTFVGKNTFKNIHKKAVIKVPSTKWKKYKNLLKGKGQKKTVVIKKINEKTLAGGSSLSSVSLKALEIEKVNADAGVKDGTVEGDGTYITISNTGNQTVGNFKISNASGKTIEALCILTSYNNEGTLINFKLEKISVNDKDNAELEIKMLTGDDQAKAFLWDANSYAPLCDSKSLREFENLAYCEKDGIIVINAADAIENTPYAMYDNTTSKSTGINGMDFAWKVTENFEDTKKGIKHEGIQLTPIRNSPEYADTGDWMWSTADDVADAPGLSYKVYVEQEGDYYLSFHSNAPNNGADSFHVGVNNQYKFMNSNAMSGGSDKNHAAVGPSWFYCDSEKLHLDQGVNTLNIWGRESGMLLRQIMLTKEKPMPARYLYFESQRSTEWLEESTLGTGYITLGELGDIELTYDGVGNVSIHASASNGESISLNASSSTDNVTVSSIINKQFTVKAIRSGYSTITVTAMADNCTTVTKTFFVNVANPFYGKADAGAPQNLIVAPATETQDSIAIVWDKPENYSDIVGYDVYLNEEEVATKSPASTHYTAENLYADTEYSFRVEAVYSQGERISSVTLYASTSPVGDVINIMEAPYSAIGDGITMNTEVIQQAIDDCSKGGTVLIPEGGVFLTGALDLKSHMTLKVEGELKGSSNPTDYLYPSVAWGSSDVGERIMTRYEGWEVLCHRSLLNIGYLNWRNRSEITCEDLDICGSGKITGGGTQLRDATIQFAKNNNWSVGTDNVYERTRGRLISIVQSKNVNLSGVQISEPPCWTVHMIYSDTVTTHGVTIRSKVLNGDGWNPDSSRNCMLFDTDIETGDDCVAIKAGKNPEGDRVGMPSENIKIFDIKCGGGGHGLAMGSEISGGINNITIRDCVVRKTIYGLQLKGTEKRGGGITNLHVQDCTFNLLLIKSNVNYNSDGDAAPDVPLFENLTFKNVIVEGTDTQGNPISDSSGAIQMAGFNKTDCHNHFIHNVLFENVTVGTTSKPYGKIVMEYCDTVNFNNVKQYNGEEPGYVLNNINKNIFVDDSLFYQGPAD